MPHPLSSSDIINHLKTLSGWTHDADRHVIQKKLVLQDFDEAMWLLQSVADLARQHDHHPDLHLTSYKHVLIELSTHSAGGVTEKDIALAREIDRLV